MAPRGIHVGRRVHEGGGGGARKGEQDEDEGWSRGRGGREEAWGEDNRDGGQQGRSREEAGEDAGRRDRSREWIEKLKTWLHASPSIDTLIWCRRWSLNVREQ